MNWHLVGPEISYIVNDSETKAFIVNARFADEATRVLEDCGTPEANRFVVGGDVDGFRPFHDLTDGQPASRPDDLGPTGSFMFYVRYDRAAQGCSSAARSPSPDESASGGLLFLFGTKPHDDNVQITQAPLYHTAVNNWTTMSLHLGHSVVLMDKWTAEGALERIERYRVTSSHMVPTMFNRMLQLPDEVREQYDVSSTRYMVHAAAPCPVETKKKMIEWWGDSIWEYYAATEGGGTYVGAAEWMTKPGTVGKPWPISRSSSLTMMARNRRPSSQARST